MKSLLLRSLVIAIVLGFLVAFLSSYLTASFYERSDTLGIDNMLSGSEAISATIRAVGFWGYFKGVLGMTFLFSGSIFLGCILLGIWERR